MKPTFFNFFDFLDRKNKLPDTRDSHQYHSGKYLYVFHLVFQKEGIGLPGLYWSDTAYTEGKPLPV